LYAITIEMPSEEPIANTPEITTQESAKRGKKGVKRPAKDPAKKTVKSKAKQPANEPKRLPPVYWHPTEEALYIRLMLDGIKTGQ